MNKNEFSFIQQNKQKWERLQELVLKKKRSFTDIRELGNLYLEAIEDFSYCQTHFTGTKSADFLNGLVQQCHLIFHRYKTPKMIQFWQFISTGFPKIIYQLRRPILVSLCLFLFANFVSFTLVRHNSELAELFVDSGTYEMVRNDLALKEQFKNFDSITKEMRVPVSFALWIHNSRVAITVFVLGATLGIGSVLLIIYNGFMVGSLMAIYYMNGNFADFISLIMTHGSVELTAIILAGGAALNIASAILFPGRNKRGALLKKNAISALYCIFGIVVLLLWAGLVEGLVTPMKLPIPVRFSIAGSNFLLLLLYASIGFILHYRNHKKDCHDEK